MTVVGSLPERRLQVPLAAREQAGPELSVRRQADAVAGRAERLGHRVDETDLAGAVREAVPPCGRRRLGGDLLERPVLLDQGANLAAGEHVVVAPGLVRVQRHEL